MEIKDLKIPGLNIETVKQFMPSSKNNGCLIIILSGGTSFKGGKHEEKIAEFVCSRGYHCALVNPRNIEDVANVDKAIKNMRKIIESLYSELKQPRIGIYGRCGGGRIGLYSVLQDQKKRIKSIMVWGMPARFSEIDTQKAKHAMEQKGYQIADNGELDVRNPVDVIQNVKIPVLFTGGLGDVEYFMPKGKICSQVDLYAKLLKNSKSPIFSIMIIRNAQHSMDSMTHSVFETFKKIILNWFDLTLTK